MGEQAPAFRVRPSPRYREVTAEEVAQAWRDYERHCASMFAPPIGELRLCIAEDCGEAFPCRRYRAAETVLRAADLLDYPGKAR